jgi:phage repressor protein C with HTH and peptisase S24 domain
MSTLGRRIAEAREARGMSRPELAAAAKISYPTLAGIENGDQRDTTKLVEIAAALKVRAEWLKTGKGEREAASTMEDGEWPDIRAYKQPASMGPGAVPDDYAETHALKFRADSLRRKKLRPDRLGVCYGKGDSMLPRIRSGDAILFDMSDTQPRDGDIFIISYDGELLAKQLTLLGDRWFIESLNKDDPKFRKPKPIDEFKQFQIHGRVRWIGSWQD